MSDLNTTVLKASLGAGYVDDRYTLPKGGSPGDIPVKTEKGVEWQKPEPATSTPDWRQNDPAASDYIKNRPGGYTVESPELTIEWDGVVGDRVSVDLLGMLTFAKVSDVVPTIGRMVGGKMTTNNGEIALTSWNVQDTGEGFTGPNNAFIVAKSDNASVAGMIFPERGIYFSRAATSSETRTKSLSLLSETIRVPIPGGMVDIPAPDWNANSADDASYIKNRPCYATETPHYEQIDEGTVIQRVSSINTSNIAMDFQSPTVSGICIEFFNDSGALAGRYILSVCTDDTAVGARKYTSADGTVSISKSVTDSSSYLAVPESLVGATYRLYMNIPVLSYTPLADGYIPSTIQRVGADVILPSSTAGSTKKFKLTVDDSGALTATEVTT